MNRKDDGFVPSAGKRHAERSTEGRQPQRRHAGRDWLRQAGNLFIGEEERRFSVCSAKVAKGLTT